MSILDCETRESTLSCIAEAYGIHEAEIFTFLNDFNLERHYEENNPMQVGSRELKNIFDTHFNRKPKIFDQIAWFHLTRTNSNNTFENGILPLTISLDNVWEEIINVFEESEHGPLLVEMRKNGVDNFQYNLKADDPLYAGPYAMLVRESAYRAKEIGNHDYLWLPEIMEDICNAYLARHGIKIHEILCAALSPKIVKFYSDGDRSEDCTVAALYYIYIKAHGQEMSIYSNTCFDGNNEAIPSEQILNVERFNK